MLSRFRPLIATWVLFSFIAIAISGVILLFHIRTLGNFGVWKHTHTWFSVAFLAGAVLHLAVNWKAQVRHFTESGKAWQWILASGLSVALLAVVLIAGVKEAKNRPQGPFGPGQGAPGSVEFDRNAGSRIQPPEG